MINNNENQADRCIYIFKGNNDVILYVGVSKNFTNRIEQHKKDKEWFNEILTISISDYMNQNMAFIYEIYYISTLKPKYNKDYNDGFLGFSMELSDLYFTDYNIGDGKIINNGHFCKIYKSFDRCFLDLEHSSCKLLLYLISKLKYGSTEVSLTNNEMIEKTGITEYSLKKSLTNLDNLGIIKRIGNSQNRKIFINPFNISKGNIKIEDYDRFAVST